MPGPDQLLADADWLRRLALALATSADEAEDLLQESRIAAWRSAPDTSRPMRPWLAKVIRDVAGMRRRSETRRHAREVGYEPQPAAAPDELLEQMRLHRLLVDLVMELEEPYRSTVIARFVEGRSAAAIARSAGIPESTVRGRLREALARLRSALDDNRGTRKAWAPAVLAFARGGVQVAKPAKSILIVIAILALLLGLIVIGLVWRGAPEATPATVTAAAARLASANPARPSDVVTKLVASGEASGWMVQPGAPSRRLAGTVLVDGTPAAGVLVRVTSELSSTGLVPVLEQRTDAAGR
ncbi:MAG TPA: sigma-70 family RNA polymerase sigma factor, partial [Kofleriaceae bacterium]